MNSPEQVVRFYLKRIEEVQHPIERRIIRDDLNLYYYRLNEEDAASVKTLMQPVLNEIEKEMIEKDLLLKQAHELLSRIKQSQAVKV